MFRKSALFLAVAFLAAGAVPLWAQTGTSEQTLPEVQVTGYGQFENQPFTEKQRATASNNIVYDRMALENSGAEVLSDFLAEQGVPVHKTPTDYDNNATQISMRGFRSDHLGKELDGHILLLIDGRRTGTNNATQISLANVERVEILRGPEMLKYAATAAGGVINVVTKKGGPDKLAGSLEAGYGFGSYDSYLGKFKLNGLVGGFDYALGYQYSEMGDYTEGRGNKVENSKTDGVNSLAGNFGYTFNDLHRVGWATYYHKVDKAHRPAYVDQSGQTWDNTYTDRYNLSNTLMYEGATEDQRFSWQTSYTFGENWSKMYGTSFGDAAEPTGAGYDRKIFDASLTYNGDMFNLTGGVQNLDYEAWESCPPPASSGALGSNSGANCTGAPSSGYPYAPTGRYENKAGFLNGDLKLLEDALILSATLRYDKFKVSDLDDRSYSAPQAAFPGGPPRERTFEHLSRSLGASYLPLDQLKLRANYTNSFRPPSPRELFGRSGNYSFWGYPDNKPEETDTYEGGFDLNLRHLSFSTTLFYSYTKDYIYQHRDLNDAAATGGIVPGVVDRQRVLNADRQVRQGIEMQLSGNVASALGYDSFELKPYINYSHLFRHQEIFRRSYSSLPSPWDSWAGWNDSYGQWINKTTIAFGLRFQHPEQKLKANLNFSYYGPIRAYSLDGTLPGTNTPASYPGMTYPGFTVANLSASKGLWNFTDTQNLELKLAVDNLFDKDYIIQRRTFSPSAYEMPGRSYYVGLVYNF